MRPFEVHSTLEVINCAYPAADAIATASWSGGSKARLALARLWLSEGIPYAFRGRPAVYEEVRFWMAACIGVDPKEISIVGSARIGQSLSPDSQGRAFGDSSDLDFIAVSNSLFKEVVDDFNKWTYEYESHTISPRNERERRFWDDHMDRGPLVIGRGFIDANMIPLIKSYPTATRIAQTMYLVTEKLRITPSAPRVKHASLRVFNSWRAFVQQAERSLLSLRQKCIQGNAEQGNAADAPRRAADC